MSVRFSAENISYRDLWLLVATSEDGLLRLIQVSNPWGILEKRGMFWCCGISDASSRDTTSSGVVSLSGEGMGDRIKGADKLLVVLSKLSRVFVEVLMKRKFKV